jgi:hypothetical protein
MACELCEQNSQKLLEQNYSVFTSFFSYVLHILVYDFMYRWISKLWFSWDTYPRVLIIVVIGPLFSPSVICSTFMSQYDSHLYLLTIFSNILIWSYGWAQQRALLWSSSIYSTPLPAGLVVFAYLVCPPFISILFSERASNRPTGWSLLFR